MEQVIVDLGAAMNAGRIDIGDKKPSSSSIDIRQSREVGCFFAPAARTAAVCRRIAVCMSGAGNDPLPAGISRAGPIDPLRLPFFRLRCYNHGHDN